jgi:hypothetical protein
MEITYIYLVTNCYNDPNKVYIGKTKNNRNLDHKKSYGKQIEYTIIDEIYSYSKKYWKPLETYWIEQFRQWGFEIMNKQKIGGSGVEFHNDKTKLKMSLSKTGRIITWKDKIGKANKGRKYSKESCELISQKLKGKKRTEETKQKISKSKTGVKYSEETKQKMRKPKPKGYKEKISIIKSKPVLQYSLNLEFIQEFPSQTYAGKIINKPQSAISECCSGKRESAYGFIWKYKKN